MGLLSETAPTAPAVAVSLHAALVAAKGQPPAKWHLVWCHADCFRKAEEKEALKQAVRSLGGAMLCFKCANKLLAWSAKQCEKAGGPAVPYFLLTHKSAAKRILSGLPRLMKPPVAVLLLSTDRRTAQRACTEFWLQGLIASQDLVSAHQDLDSVVQKLVKMLPQQLATPADRIGTIETALQVQHPWPSKEPLVLVYHTGRVQIALADDPRAPQLPTAQAPSLTAEILTALQPERAWATMPGSG